MNCGVFSPFLSLEKLFEKIFCSLKVFKMHLQGCLVLTFVSRAIHIADAISFMVVRLDYTGFPALSVS